MRLRGRGEGIQKKVQPQTPMKTQPWMVAVQGTLTPKKFSLCINKANLNDNQKEQFLKLSNLDHIM